MVRASTVVVAALAIVPVLAIPLTEETPQDVFARGVEESIDDLEARKFRFGRFIKGIAKKAIRTAVPGAALVVRDVEDETSLEAREPTHHESAVHAHHTHEARELDLVEEDLSLREPEPATAVKAASAVRHRVNKVGGTRKPAGKRTRSGKGTRGKGRKGPKKHRKHRKHGRGRGRRNSRRPGSRSGSHSRPRPRSLEVFEDESLEAREGLDLESSLVDLIERGYLEVIEDVDSREPKFRLGNIIGKVTSVAGKVGQVAGKVANVASALGSREFEDGDFLEEREFDDEDFEARAEESLDELD